MTRRWSSLVATLGLAMLFAAPAQADLLFSLTVDYCTGGCGTAPFGTVRLHDNGAGGVDVTVDLETGVGFVSSGAGEALNFNLDGNPDISGSVSNLTSGFSLDPTVPPNLIHAAGSGYWQYGIICDSAIPGCGNGGNTPNPGPLGFTIAGVTISDFIATTTGGPGNHGSLGNFFASDICGSFTAGAGCTGNTGVVAATGPGEEVPPLPAPEPGSLLLLGAGLLALGRARWRRRSSGF